jgi:hypothetical protein
MRASGCGDIAKRQISGQVLYMDLSAFCPLVHNVDAPRLLLPEPLDRESREAADRSPFAPDGAY